MASPSERDSIEAGLVTPEAVEKALEHQKITGHKLGDCLVELGLLQEAALLRFLAAEFKTRFVSAEKLAKAKLPDRACSTGSRCAWPRRRRCCRCAYDPERKLLSWSRPSRRTSRCWTRSPSSPAVRRSTRTWACAAPSPRPSRSTTTETPPPSPRCESPAPGGPPAYLPAIRAGLRRGRQRRPGAAPGLQLRRETDPRMRARGPGTQMSRMVHAAARHC